MLPWYVVVPGGTLDTQLVLRYHLEPGIHIQVYSGSDEVHLRAAWDISWVLGGVGTRRYCACFHLEKFFTKNIPYRNFLAIVIFVPWVPEGWEGPASCNCCTLPGEFGHDFKPLEVYYIYVVYPCLTCG